MSKQITRWKPDTCGCSILIHWDSDNPEIKNYGVEKLCSRHTHVNEARDDNFLKNKAVSSIAQDRAGEVGWTFLPDGTLELLLPTGVDKIEAQQAIAGMARVKIK